MSPKVVFTHRITIRSWERRHSTRRIRPGTEVRVSPGTAEVANTSGLDIGAASTVGLFNDPVIGRTAFFTRSKPGHP
jgi:hypothetical protein